MYLNHFHLTTQPFSLTPDVEFFCSLPSHKEALDAVVFSIDNNEHLIKVTGEIGVGKTIVCKKVIDTLQSRYTVCHIANPNFTAQDLYRTLLKQLNIETTPQQTRFDLLEKIQTKLEKSLFDEKPVVLVIDEAQVMSIQLLESLRLLTNFEFKNQKMIRIILFGQPELDHILKQKCMRQFIQRISFSFKIRAMNADECQNYITHRLKKAGHPTGFLFDKKSTNKIHSITKGVPRVIHVIAHKALFSSYIKNQQNILLENVKAAYIDSKDMIKSTIENADNSDNELISKVLLVGSFFMICLVSYLYIEWSHAL